MNDKILIPWKLFYPELDYLKDDKGALISRSDLEALLAKPEPKLVKGAVCRVWNKADGDDRYLEILNTKTYDNWNNIELLDWETLGYTIAQNYPEAKWFAVNKFGFLRFFTCEPAEDTTNEGHWIGIPVDFYCCVTLPPGVDWKTTKRRIERI